MEEFHNKNIVLLKKVLDLKESSSLSLAMCIKKIAKEYKIKNSTAKNYYYKALKQIEIEENLNDIKIPEKRKFRKFNEKEISNLQNFIEENKKKGISIRQSCCLLASGNAKQMLRFQNKYRSLYKKVKNGQTLVSKNKIDSKKSNIRGEEMLNEEKSNVINIENAKSSLNKKLTDSDINSLFLGLIRLVKKSALENVEKELKDDYIMASNNFRQSLIDLNKAEMNLKKEQQKNLSLSIKLENQKEQICSLLERLSKFKEKSKLKNKTQNKKGISQLNNSKSKQNVKKTANLGEKCYNLTIAEFKVKKGSINYLGSSKTNKVKIESKQRRKASN